MATAEYADIGAEADCRSGDHIPRFPISPRNLRSWLELMRCASTMVSHSATSAVERAPDSSASSDVSSASHSGCSCAGFAPRLRQVLSPCCFVAT